MSKFTIHINKKIKTYLIIVILLNIVTIAIYSAMLYFVKVEKSEIVVLEENIENKQQLEQNASSIKHLILDTKKERSELNSYLVDSNELVGFIEKLESVGKHSGVSVKLSSVEEKKEDGLITINLSADGKWKEVAYFLKLIEALPKKINIERVVFTKLKKKVLWHGDMTIILGGLIGNTT